MNDWPIIILVLGAIFAACMVLLYVLTTAQWVVS